MVEDFILKKRKLLADSIIKHRKSKNFTQKMLAEKIGVDQNCIAQIENSQADVDLRLIFKICEALDISEYDLFNYN
ncbi:MAG: helix-turn-helix transcriptional regulator [Candidatus Gastranaerophilales bacterium]|nr:helix-turn-helix transcriptional regulator [Candidatus Gastranaerophilales bacterium]